MKDLAAKFSDLASWLQNDLAHSLAKKLTQKEVDKLILDLERIKRESIAIGEDKK